MIDREPVKRTKDLIKIKVIGVGGGGNNAVNQMIVSDVDGVEYILVNTEKGILERANTNGCKTLQIGKEVAQGLGAGANPEVGEKAAKESIDDIDKILVNTEKGILERANTNGCKTLQIGKEVAQGLGAGANPEVGEKAAKESIDDIDKILDGTDLLFVTAGMGGGTGTGAIPVIAEEAKKKGILTIGIVTTPFLFEGKLRKTRANLGIDKLKPNVNALIVISNDKLLKNTESNVSILNAFKMTDDILRQGIQSITDIINSVGTINVDFADVQTILSYQGFSYMGIGKSSGENKIVEATLNALNNPLTETGIDGAKGVIFNIKGSEDISLEDINKSASLIGEKVSPDANVIFGTVIDEDLGDNVVVTVVATGVEEKEEKLGK